MSNDGVTKYLWFHSLDRHQLGKLSDNVARFSEPKASTCFVRMPFDDFGPEPAAMHFLTG